MQGAEVWNSCISEVAFIGVRRTVRVAFIRAGQGPIENLLQSGGSCSSFPGQDCMDVHYVPQAGH
jgi:hypothetical protein